MDTPGITEKNILLKDAMSCTIGQEKNPNIFYRQTDSQKNENSHWIGQYFFFKCMLKK